ncbi:BA75_02354T0 [Komagataella pastoris]|uniref:BA75_02354T0 n=1 Tax=Komagataella pastoris TaxID=4922 RepID=A0A1B2JC75_PICPA|nr:BA75_02354T0 [Komagataella pastoris]
MQKVLLDLGFKSIQFLPESLLYCFGSGIRNAIIVDVSWEGVYIIPVYDLRILNSSVKATNRGYKNLHYSGSRNLDVYDFDSVFYELEKYASYSASIEEVKEIFFPLEDNEHLLDNEEQSVSKLLVELVQELPIDIRKELRSKILITNKFLVPHFKEILHEEIDFIGTKIFSSLDVWQCTSLYADYFSSVGSHGEWPDLLYSWLVSDQVS